MFVSFRVSPLEENAILNLQKKLERNRSDTIRFVIREYSKMVAEKPRRKLKRSRKTRK